MFDKECVYICMCICVEVEVELEVDVNVCVCVFHVVTFFLQYSLEGVCDSFIVPSHLNR